MTIQTERQKIAMQENHAIRGMLGVIRTLSVLGPRWSGHTLMATNLLNDIRQKQKRMIEERNKIDDNLNSRA